MNLIRTIRDEDLATGVPAPESYRERRASRAIVLDREGKIALMHAAKLNYHKLPGGGIEEDESIEEALHREILEEVGCAIENLRELARIDEYRNATPQYQISYCFIADLAGEKGANALDEGELAEGFEPVWMTLAEAIRQLASEAPVADYSGKFMQVRDLAFLEEAARVLEAA